ncbi:MAG: sialate O-acetylesterase, partial [Planctomycetales bacterium]
HCTLFNGMVHPVVPYGIKGVIWYQGESNSGNRAAEYAVLFEAMVHGWRKSWEKPELPFYMAQLASFGKEGEGRQWLTEAQRLAARNVENAGLAILNDVGETKDVHPKNRMCPPIAARSSKVITRKATTSSLHSITLDLA